MPYYPLAAFWCGKRGQEIFLKKIWKKGLHFPETCGIIIKRQGERQKTPGRGKWIWGYSSAGRALEWHSRGQRFDPAYLHQRVRKKACFREKTSLFPFLWWNRHIQPFQALPKGGVPCERPPFLCPKLGRIRNAISKIPNVLYRKAQLYLRTQFHTIC